MSFEKFGENLFVPEKNTEEEISNDNLEGVWRINILHKKTAREVQRLLGLLETNRASQINFEQLEELENKCSKERASEQGSSAALEWQADDIKKASLNVEVALDSIKSAKGLQEKNKWKKFKKSDEWIDFVGLLVGIKPAAALEKGNGELITQPDKLRGIIKKSDKAGPPLLDKDFPKRLRTQNIFVYNPENAKKIIAQNKDVFIDLLENPQEITDKDTQTIINSLAEPNTWDYLENVKIGLFLGFGRNDAELFARYQILGVQWEWRLYDNPESAGFSESEKVWMFFFRCLGGKGDYKQILEVAQEIKKQNIWFTDDKNNDSQKNATQVIDQIIIKFNHFAKSKEKNKEAHILEDFSYNCHEALKPFIEEQILKNHNLPMGIKNWFLNEKSSIGPLNTHASYDNAEKVKQIAQKQKEIIFLSGADKLLDKETIKWL